jgi:FkbM family methyltransferase
MLVERNKEWLTSDISLTEKLRYYPSFVTSYARLVTTHDKHIRYFGQDFHFDNPATPFNLQNYPFEITHKILRHMDIIPKNVIDIGANIGQFPLTIAAVVPGAHVDALEPNGDIYEILQRNVKNYSNITTYNVGVGKTKKAKMFYEPTRSGTGSLLADNAGSKESVKEIPIKLIDNIPALTKRSEYDLITIDVEGYEMDVVQCLKGMRTRYLFVEVSTQGRTKNYKHSAFFKAIRDALGDFDIVYTLGHSARLTPTFDMLLEFSDKE